MMPCSIAVQPSPTIAVMAVMETEAQRPFVCPPVSHNSPPPSTPQEITITAATEAQEAEDSNVVNSVILLGGHTDLNAAPTQEQSVRPPKKQCGKKSTLQSDTRSLVAYYKDCATEEDPIPCDDEFLCICNELEVVGTSEFYESRVQQGIFLTKCQYCEIFCNPNIVLFVQTTLKSCSRCTRAIKTRSSFICTACHRGNPMPITRTSSIFRSTISRHDQVKNLLSSQKKSAVLS